MNSAFLEFFRFLTAFGYKSHARDEGFGGFDYHVRSCSDGNKEDETVKSLGQLFSCVPCQIPVPM